MKVNVLFYGGCQADAVLQVLNLNDTYNTFWIRCKRTNLDKESFTKIISECDIIITQPIKDDYRGVDYLSTSYIIQHKKPECKVIIFDSCYFNFYYFDTFHDDEFIPTMAYQYKTMIECFKNGHSAEYYINNFVNNFDLKTSEELETIAEDNLEELNRRYKRSKALYEQNNVYPITIYDYIKQNYRDKLLFYTVDHPSKYVLQSISEKIIDILQIPNTVNYNIDPFQRVKCIIYNCISKNVSFDITSYKPKIRDIENTTQIVQMYYETFKTISLSY